MIKVLVVDDDPDIRALVSAWLRGSEFQLIVGEDGYQAVQLARTQRPDVILLDINMPAGKGFVIHERLKHISSVATVPIVYISADRTAEPQALAAGAARFMAKPLEKERVLSTLREVCQASS
jgi:two-component system alkaline phosphatase synthesis response regulator PhoP